MITRFALVDGVEEELETLAAPVPSYPYCQNEHEVFERWTAIGSGQRAPTPDEAHLMEVVKQALSAGVFYETDLQKYVKEHADFIPAEAWDVKGRTYGGVMGYEAYSARTAIENIATRLENQEAVKNYSVGQKIGALYINAKRVNALVIEKIDGTTVIMIGKSGSNTVQVSIAARAIETAKQRAIQRGWRKA